MNVKIIENREDWNGFVVTNGGSFLQSWEWGNFQHDYGRRVYRIGVEENGEIVAGAQIIRYDLPAKKSYFFSPRGPQVFDEKILDKIKELALENNCLFWRLEPAEKDAGEKNNLIKTKDVHPKKTLILNLNDSDNQLLANMKPKTRYNIRLAAKKGVRVRVNREIKDIDDFYNLISKTASRQSIKVFPKSYYQLMMHVMGDLNMANLYLAEHDGKVIAANLMLAFGDTMTYLHGGTDHEYRNLMAPNLLQWQAIMDAKNAGMKKYDFFGVSDEIPSWAGITKFKRGFGGNEVEYPGTYEMPFNRMWYRGYNLLKKIKK